MFLIKYQFALNTYAKCTVKHCMQYATNIIIYEYNTNIAKDSIHNFNQISNFIFGFSNISKPLSSSRSFRIVASAIVCAPIKGSDAL